MNPNTQRTGFQPTSWFRLRWFGVAMAGAVAMAWLFAAGESHSAAASAEDCLRLEQGLFRIAVGEKAAPTERRAAELFVAEVRRRTGLDLLIGGAASTKHTLVVGTAQSSAEIALYIGGHPQAGKLEADGFHLATTPDAKGRLYVVGQSPSGVMAGIGKLLRLSRYADGAMEIPRLTLNDHPRMPVRGMYFATHFGNFYHVAPLEEVDRVIEELALWGANSLSVWFDTEHFKSFQDPVAQTQFARLKHFGETAHRLGMQFGLTFVPNEPYNDANASHKHLLARYMGGYRPWSFCPSKPEALAQLGKYQAEILDAFRSSPGVDFIWCWPYDSGGCSCDQCKPWGAKGFLLVSEQLARLYRERCPQGKVWLSTWCFDFFCGTWGNHEHSLCDKRSEHDQFFQHVREKKPAWFDGIITGTYADDGIQRRILHERPYPDRYPVTNFPEISMHASPWGGYGADPLTTYNTRMARELRRHTVGGWPYSEGIYEDLNKFFWVQSYWNPERTADDLQAEYATYYLGPELATDAVRLFALMEGMQHHTLRLKDVSRVDESWAIAEKINSRLATWAKTSWRWRILHIRASIDRIAKTMPGYYATPEIRAALEPFRAELASIYHGNWVFPLPPLPDPRDLSYLQPLTVSSTLPGWESSAAMLVDGDFAGHDSFWVHDPATEQTAWACIDLGKPADIHEVRLGFRNLGGKYAFVPGSLGFEVSHDGKNFAPAGTSAKVPKEDDAVTEGSLAWTYEIGKPGRYLRVNLGASQRKQQPFAGTLELTEIQVFEKPSSKGKS